MRLFELLGDQIRGEGREHVAVLRRGMEERFGLTSAMLVVTSLQKRLLSSIEAFAHAGALDLRIELVPEPLDLPPDPELEAHKAWLGLLQTT